MDRNALILLIEDSEDDCILMQRAFRKAKILNPLLTIRSGEEAMEYLSGLGKYNDRALHPLPSLVLLDLKMPGIDGFEVLKWIRGQPWLKALRVVILTSSNQIWDVNLAYKLGANSFLVKPVDLDRFVELSQAVSGYWLWLDKEPEAIRPPPVVPQSPTEKPPEPLGGTLPS